MTGVMVVVLDALEVISLWILIGFLVYYGGAAKTNYRNDENNVGDNGFVVKKSRKMRVIRPFKDDKEGE